MASKRLLFRSSAREKSLAGASALLLAEATLTEPLEEKRESASRDEAYA
jgi:hypothetical protein